MSGRGRPRLRVGDHGRIEPKKQPDGSWRVVVRVCDSDGKVRQVRRVAPTKTKVIEAITDALAKRRNHLGELNADTPLGEIAERWFRVFDEMVEDGSRAPNSLRVYRGAWDLHLEPALGQVRVGEVGVSLLENLLLTLRRERGAGITRTARAVLNGIFGYAVRHEAITRNPAREVSRINGGRKRKPRALTEAERNKWLTAVANDKKARARDLPDLCAFLLATGVRIAESLAVTFADIDFMENTVAIDHQIIRVTGKGLFRVRTKTLAGERTLRLPEDWAMTMLWRRYGQLGEGPVFPAIRDPRKWRDPHNTQKHLREARAKVEGLEWLHFHAFRKTVATILDEGGLSGREVADQLGHSKVSMTQDAYMGRSVASPKAAAALNAAIRMERMP